MISFRYKLLCLLLLICGSASAQYSLYEKGLDSYKKEKYDQAITLFSDYFNKPMRDKKIDVDVYYYRALSYYKKGDFKNAVNDFEETILLNRDNKGNIYWFMAKANDNLGAYNESIGDYTNALKEITDNVPRGKLYYERSLVYGKSGNLAAVQDDLTAGNSVDPNNIDIKNALERMNTKMATNRTIEKKENTRPAGSDKPAPDKTTTTPDKKVVEESTTEKEKKPSALELKNGSNKGVTQPAASKDNRTQVASQPLQTQPVVTTPVVTTPAEPTLADMYKDERRFALVIGNSKYPKEIGVLKNPVNDATDIAKELRAANFDVMLLTDATYGQMRANMLKFKEKVDAGDRDKTVALFYYAGHGLQHDDENYLIPVDASLEYEDDIARYCFPIQRMVLANMERSNSRMNIVILDACRNNPFPALTRSAGQQGLGEMKRGRGSFIAYATAPGSVAADGNGRNGLYTQELLKAMAKPGHTIEQVFKEVRQNVLRQSGDKQNTWDSSNIVGDFYFRF